MPASRMAIMKVLPMAPIPKGQTKVLANTICITERKTSSESRTPAVSHGKGGVLTIAH